MWQVEERISGKWRARLLPFPTFTEADTKARQLRQADPDLAVRVESQLSESVWYYCRSPDPHRRPRARSSAFVHFDWAAAAAERRFRLFLHHNTGLRSQFEEPIDTWNEGLYRASSAMTSNQTLLGYSLFDCLTGDCAAETRGRFLNTRLAHSVRHPSPCQDRFYVIRMLWDSYSSPDYGRSSDRNLLPAWRQAYQESLLHPHNHVMLWDYWLWKPLAYLHRSQLYRQAPWVANREPMRVFTGFSEYQMGSLGKPDEFAVERWHADTIDFEQDGPCFVRCNLTNELWCILDPAARYQLPSLSAPASFGAQRRHVCLRMWRQTGNDGRAHAARQFGLPAHEHYQQLAACRYVAVTREHGQIIAVRAAHDDPYYLASVERVPLTDIVDMAEEDTPEAQAVWRILQVGNDVWELRVPGVDAYERAEAGDLHKLWRRFMHLRKHGTHCQLFDLPSGQEIEIHQSRPVDLTQARQRTLAI